MMVKETEVSRDTEARRQRLVRDFVEALGHHSIHLVYQPSFTLKTRKVVSVEALCRWNHPDLGAVAADEFIHIAESNGLISALGDQVLQRVLNDLPTLLSKWPSLRVAINVSGLELAEPGFADRKITVIESVSPLYAKHIEWEVTESHQIIDMELANQHLDKLRKHQMTTAMDDFGVGQSTLVRLYQLPFDKIKLDRAFVLGLNHITCQSIIRAMSSLAANLKKELVIEGVETEEQLSILATLGCSLGQGYLFCKPVGLKELMEIPT